MIKDPPEDTTRFGRSCQSGWLLYAALSVVLGALGGTCVLLLLLVLSLIQ